MKDAFDTSVENYVIENKKKKKKKFKIDALH